ncbi:MAG TPA: DegT/DnrJ/EryC1/StrS family aminotransferase [Longimicrobium sp.]
MPAEGGLPPLSRAAKRAFDVVGAAVGLAVTGPVIVLAYLAATVDTRRNGFFAQTRVGRHGRPFRVLKIRTMRDVPGVTTSVTTSGDPRITRLGRLLRRSKIDELPQLVNVLLGHMSFVGPRPDVPGFADRLEGDDRVVLSIRPGITGPATLRFRNEQELLAGQAQPEAYNRDVLFPAKVRINVDYIRRYSFIGDLRYLWWTLWGCRPGVTDTLEATMTESRDRVYLSPPHMSGQEQELIGEVFASNWIAPLGPQVDAFEREFAGMVGSPHAAALSSGTAALHLALKLVGVGPGDEVLVSTLTFSASVNPILYLGGVPVFIDSEEQSWNMSPELLAHALHVRARRGRLPRAVVLVHLYGQSADVEPILDVCEHYGVPVVEDAAEALGATYHGRAPGTFGRVGIFSFNGNKIITSSAGGMLVSDDERLVARARNLASQARDPVPHYQHSELGYNYRMSNVLAAIGRAQLRVLEDRVVARRRNFDRYRDALGELPGIRFMPEAPWGRSSRWLTCITVDPDAFGATREDLRLALEAENIEARPVWKPMHVQPVFRGYEAVGGRVAEHLFDWGLCLPSGSSLTDADHRRVTDVIASVAACSPAGAGKDGRRAWASAATP